MTLFRDVTTTPEYAAYKRVQADKLRDERVALERAVDAAAHDLQEATEATEALAAWDAEHDDGE